MGGRGGDMGSFSAKYTDNRFIPVPTAYTSIIDSAAHTHIYFSLISIVE